MRRQNNFDLLRLLFAFIVFLLHFVELTNATQLNFLNRYFTTYYSILGFFIISGFLITQSYTLTNSNVMYFKKRAMRIFPAYTLVVVLAFLLLSFVSTYSPKEYFTHPNAIKYLVSNLLCLNFLQPCLPGVFTNNFIGCPVNGSLWTIKVEVMFYLLLPMIIKLVDRKNRYIRGIGLALVYLISYFIYISPNYFDNKILEIASRQLPGYLTFFASGMILFYFKVFFQNHKNVLFVVSIFVVVFRHNPYLNVLFPLAFAIVIYFFAFGLKYLNGVIFFGDISYGVYIYHFPIIQLFISLGMYQKYNFYAMMLLTFVLVLSLSYLSWNYFEKPLLKLVRKEE